MPIEKLSNELDRLVSADAEIKDLADGFGGDTGPPRGRYGGPTAAFCCSATSTTAAG